MTTPAPEVIQSIRQRLRNRALEKGEDFQHTLTRYGVERFLYRLSRSRWADQFVVKGATLFYVWLDQPHRPTRDLDVTWLDADDRTRLELQIREICTVACLEDGLAFDLSALLIESIRGKQEDQGLRARFLARLGNARIHLQLDVGFGDVVTPAPTPEDFPTLLNLPAPRIKLYPQETFIAEKFEAMVRMGSANSRYKDFSDVALLAAYKEFEGSLIRGACANTFEFRGTPLVAGDRPAALRPQFYADDSRISSWQGFAAENPSLEHLGSFPTVGELVISFLAPLWDALARDLPWNARWMPGGPWKTQRADEDTPSTTATP